MAGLLTIQSCLQSVFGSVLTMANLTTLLGLSQTNYTIFAPVNSAFLAALTRGNITCVTSYYIEQPCTSTTSLLQADNLPQIVLNHGACWGSILAAWLFVAVLHALLALCTKSVHEHAAASPSPALHCSRHCEHGDA